MTKFNKDHFHKEGDCLVYGERGWINGEWKNDCKFVARFKYGRGGAGSHKAFMVKNFTVEEYFGRLEAGESPLNILESKGYIQDHVKKWMKEAGYTVFTTETKEHWFQNVYRASFKRITKAA